MGNKAKTKNCSKTNRALFEQDTSFQGNMPLTLYFSLTGDTNGQVRLQEELFTRVAQDTFPFAETVVFHLESAAGSSTRLARFRSIAESYKINIKTNEQPIPKGEQTSTSWLNSSVFICENGDVLVFDPASLPSIIVGNLHDSRLPDIWYGPLYELLRAALPKQSFNLPFDSLSFTDPQQIINHFPQSDSYEMHLESLDQIHAYEKTLALEQKELLQQARTKEAELESQFTTLSTSEREAVRNKRLRSMFMPWAYKKSTRIKSMLGDRVDSFGLLASTFPFEKQIERDLNQALKGYGPEFMGNMPTLMELAVTYGCNLRCFMCDQVKQGEEQQRVMLRQQLDLPTYREMAEDLFPTLETMIIGVAGEPTLHPDFTEFVRLGYEYGVMMKLLTNGTILNAPKVADAAIRYLDEMYVSIDGCTKETFEKIRTRGKFDQVCKGLERINALREEHPESPLKISVNFTLMKDNIDEFPGMFAFAKKYGIHRVMADHLIVTTPEIQDKSLFNDKELCDKRLLEAVEEAKKHGVEIFIPELFNKKERAKMQDVTLTTSRSSEINEDIPFCRLLTHSIIVGPLGHVYPCCHPDAHRLLGMGNLKNKRFKRIWYGRSYQTLREGMKGVIPYPCSNCSMSGRSDGDVPLTKETENKDFLTEANPFIPYPKQFIPRRLRFLGFVYNQNIAVKRHLDNLQAIEKQAKAYQEKLLTA